MSSCECVCVLTVAPITTSSSSSNDDASHRPEGVELEWIKYYFDPAPAKLPERKLNSMAAGWCARSFVSIIVITNGAVFFYFNFCALEVDAAKSTFAVCADTFVNILARKWNNEESFFVRSLWELLFQNKLLC